MRKYQLLLFVLLSSLNSIALADEEIVSCPTVDEIRRDAFRSWLPLYKENEELASDKDVALFKEKVARFEIARWSTRYLESAQCAYQGADSIVNKIVFAQQTWHPVTSSHWFWLTPDHVAECRAGEAQECRFIKD